MMRDKKCFEWVELSAVSIDRECLVGRRDLCDSGAAADGFQSGFRLGSNPFPRCGHGRAFTYNYVKSHPKHAALHDLSATQSEAARSECVVLSELALHDLLSSGSNKVWYATSLPDMEALCRTDQQFSYDACSVKYGFWKRSATKTDISPIPRCEANPREGRRRNPTNWTYTTVPTPTNTRHGYTGHEHLDKFALINMNGRVYDPIIGRFLSPDPYIQAPYFAQNFDRYSYVWNNPLKYVDPSGYLMVPIYRDHGLSGIGASRRQQNDELDWIYGRGLYAIDGPAVSGLVLTMLVTTGVGGGNSVVSWVTTSNSGMTISGNSDYNGTYQTTTTNNGQTGSWVQVSGAITYGMIGGRAVAIVNLAGPTCVWVPSGVNYGYIGNDYIGSGWTNTVGKVNDGIGGLGTGMSRLGGSFGLANSQGINVKYYATNWGGNQYVKTYNSYKWGSRISKGSFVVSVALGGYNILQGYSADGNVFGYNAQVATGETVGGIAGGWGGAATGAAAGLAIGGPIGAVVGGVVGGFFGGWGGSELGGGIVGWFY